MKYLKNLLNFKESLTKRTEKKKEQFLIENVNYHKTSVKNLGEGKVEVQDDFEIVCWDLVSNPSTQGAFMGSLNEGVQQPIQDSKYSKVNTLIGDIITTM